jgi:hypothetical protein
MKIIIVAIMLLSGLFFLYSQFDYVYGQNITSKITSKNTGFDFGNQNILKELAKSWWQWAYSLPMDKNPGVDKTGVNCSQGQNGPVFFLIGSFDGSLVKRECVVPKDKPLFFPILNSECSPIEYPSVRSDEGLKKCAKTFQDMAKGLKASLDGKPLPVIRIVTDVFNFTLPGNNIFGTGVPMESHSASDGHFSYVASLTPGTHILKFSGSTEPTSTSLNDFRQENVYKIIVPR